MAELNKATCDGNIVEVTRLLNSGADVNIKSKSLEKTALIIAARHGQVEIAGLLLERGANIEATCYSGETPLICAVQNGHTKTVRMLLDWKANTEAVKNFNLTALMIAAQNSNNKTVDLLLKRGANIEAEDWLGETVLFVAVRHGHYKTVALLLKRGANAMARSGVGRTVLMVASDCALKDSAKIVQMILEKGVGVNNVIWNGWTALIFAAHGGTAKIASMLLERGATVDHRSDSSGAAIDVARKEGKVDVVDLLTAHAEVLIDAREGAAVGRAKAMIMAGTRPYPHLTLSLLAQCLGPVDAAELASWASEHVADTQGCFVALFEGSGRLQGRLVSLRRCTALHVHFPAKRRIIDFLVFKSPETRALLCSIASGLK